MRDELSAELGELVGGTALSGAGAAERVAVVSRAVSGFAGGLASTLVEGATANVVIPLGEFGALRVALARLRPGALNGSSGEEVLALSDSDKEGFGSTGAALSVSTALLADVLSRASSPVQLSVLLVSLPNFRASTPAGEGATLGTTIVGVTLLNGTAELPVNGTGSSSGVFNISIPLPTSYVGTPKCAFWDERRDSWDGAGCTALGVSGGVLCCGCEHLTGARARARPRAPPARPTHRYPTAPASRCRPRRMRRAPCAARRARVRAAQTLSR